jgi:hypothetical protein
LSTPPENSGATDLLKDQVKDARTASEGLSSRAGTLAGFAGLTVAVGAGLVTGPLTDRDEQGQLIVEGGWALFTYAALAFALAQFVASFLAFVFGVMVRVGEPAVDPELKSPADYDTLLEFNRQAQTDAKRWLIFGSWALAGSYIWMVFAGAGILIAFS